MNTNLSSPFQIGEYFRSVAKERWLFPYEIYEILTSNVNELGFVIPTVKPDSIPYDGQLSVYNKVYFNFKTDGIQYIRKKSTDKIQETYQNIKIDGKEVIRGVYSRAADNQNFKRRIYTLFDKTSTLFLVHYRECPEVARVVTNAEIADKHKHFAAMRSNSTQNDMLLADNYDFADGNFLSDEIINDLMSLDSPDFGEHSKAVFTDNESCTNFNGSDHISSNNSNGNSINNSTSNSNNNSYYNSDSVSNSNNNSAYNSYSNSFTSNSSSNPFQVFLNSQPRSRFGSEFSDQNNISGSAVIQSYNSMVQQVSDFFQTDKEGDTDSDVVVFSRGSGDGSTNNSTRRSTESKSKIETTDFACEIDDFSPSRDNIAGGTKILLCIQSSSPFWGEYVATGAPVFVNFGDQRVQAEKVTNTMIRCYSPSPHTMTGQFHLWITDHQQNILSKKSEQTLEVYGNTQRTSTEGIALDQSFLAGTDNHPYASSSSTFTTNQQSNFISHSCSNSSSSLFYLNNHRGKPWLPLQTNPDQQHQHDNQSTKSKFRSHPRIDDDNSLFREHKIRIVERLGSVKTALSTFEDADETELIPRRRTSKDESQQNLFGPDSLSLRGSNSSTAFLTQRLDSESLKNMNVAMLDSISPSNKTQPLNNEEIAKAMVNAGVNIERNLTSSDKLLPVQTNGENFEWLDDNQLSQLSNHQLESLMDKLVMNVVKQLVQLASVDDDLKAEIDLLDNAGFSLLHYCCLYNLNSLVPVLLAKGANVDKKSSTGTAPLHLAAGSGHLALTQLLVECNATLEIYDSNNMLPSDVALLANQRAVYDYLYQEETTRRQRSGIRPREYGTLSTDFGHIDTENNAVLPSLMNDDSYVQQVFNKDASDSSLMENNPLIRSPSNSWKLNLPSTPHSQDANSVDNTSLSSMLLHEAFSSLSLTDKCALSLSISQLNQSNSNTNPTSPMANTTVVMSSTNQISSSTANSTHVTPRNSYNSIDISGGGVGLNRNHSGDFSGRRLTGESIGDDLEFEMQSVISENDKESLDVAMSMMGAQEIEQVESEVRRIQNNVRGWLLRKNYTNLRDAARVLQVAWREKRKNQGVLSPKGQNASIFGTSPTDESPLMNSKMGYAKAKQFDNHNICSSTNSSYSSTVSGLTATFTALNKSSVVDNHSSRELHAAATLQAATRGMLARRSFSSVRRQTMASLVIQKRLLKWYTDSKSSGDDESSSPLSLL